MIRAEDLRLSIDDREILRGVSFEVARGESVALAGPNGSGKTTVLRCLLGLVPFEGRASIDGHDVVRDGVAARTVTGYVPQKVAFGDARAREVLAFVARLRGVRGDRIPAALGEVGLLEHADGRVRTFSGGMQQRLAIAVALLGDPQVLLLDEPSASLDVEGQEAFTDLVRRLRGSGHTLLLASHRNEEVGSLTDRVIRLEAGVVVGSSPAEAAAGGATGALPAQRSARVVRLAAKGERR